MLFGEISSCADEKLINIGLRYWHRRDRLATDFSHYKKESAPGSTNGVSLSIAFYELLY